MAINGSDLSFYRYEIYQDSTILIEYRGALQERPGTSTAPPAPPDSVLASIQLSESVLSLIHDRATESGRTGRPDRQFGFHLERKRLRLQFDQGVPIWVAILTGVSLVAAGGGLVGATLTRRERLRRRDEASARQRALHAREAERSRLAREIHDGPLQDVHALRMISGSQGSSEVSDEAGRIARELRAIAEGLRPPALGRFGLAAALSAHANRVKERYPTVAVGLELDEDGTGPDALPDVVRSSLFRIAQESITNAIEHGGARRVNVGLHLPKADRPDGAGDITLEIADDGKGFPWPGPVPDLSKLADGGHFGLVGMYERVEAIGGTLTLSPDGIGGAGARVHVTLPDMRRTIDANRGRRRPRRPAPA